MSFVCELIRAVACLAAGTAAHQRLPPSCRVQASAVNLSPAPFVRRPSPPFDAFVRGAAASAVNPQPPQGASAMGTPVWGSPSLRFGDGGVRPRLRASSGMVPD